MNCPACLAPLREDARGETPDACPRCATPIPRHAPTAKDGLLASAIREYESAAGAGQAPDPATFCARYPQIGSELRKALSVVGRIERLDESERDAITASPPDRLGPYTIRGMVGEGGMAPVFRATDDRLDRDVALKVLLPHPLRVSSRRDRFLREARALARIDHPNVVPVHDVGEDGPWCYIAMELMAGSLAERVVPATDRSLETERLREVVRWTGDAATGLGHAHGRGILHRDVKPGNLLLGADGRVRVADFGLAWFEGVLSLTGTGAVVGTPRYASPEQSRGEAPTIASDVYGLGASLYHLATGLPPPDPLYRGAPLEFPASIPAGLRAVITRAVAPPVAERYPDMAAFAADLAAWLEGRLVGAPSHRWRWVTVAGVGAVLGLLAYQQWRAGATVLDEVLTRRPPQATDVRDVTFADAGATFDGRTSGIEFPPGVFPLEGTIELVLRTERLTHGSVIDMVGIGNARAGDARLVVTDDSTVYFYFDPVGGIGPHPGIVTLDSRNPITSTGFRTVAMSYGSRGLRLYLDGLPQSQSSDLKARLGDNAVALGTLPDAGGRPFCGQVYRVRISRRQADLRLHRGDYAGLDRLPMQGCLQNHVPDVSDVKADPDTLWPPDGQMQQVTLSGATDLDGDPVTIKVIRVHQDEPVPPGQDDPAPSAVMDADSVLLRAKRSDDGDGRVYLLSYEVGDGTDSLQGSVVVCVPRARGIPCVEGRSLFDSTKPAASRRGGN